MAGGSAAGYCRVTLSLFRSAALHFSIPSSSVSQGGKEGRNTGGCRDTDGILNLAGGYMLFGVRLMVVVMMMIGANMHPRVIVNRGRLVQPSSIYSPALITIASTTITAEFHGSEGTGAAIIVH